MEMPLAHPTEVNSWGKIAFSLLRIIISGFRQNSPQLINTAIKSRDA